MSINDINYYKDIATIMCTLFVAHSDMIPENYYEQDVRNNACVNIVE